GPPIYALITHTRPITYKGLAHTEDRFQTFEMLVNDANFRRTAHHPKGLADFSVGKNIQERRLFQFDGQRLLQRVIAE
ncbi:MAG: hypothetical protein WBL22_15715, partial [Candidatus Sulfotelmatobacter sp.]